MECNRFLTLKVETKLVKKKENQLLAKMESKAKQAQIEEQKQEFKAEESVAASSAAQSSPALHKKRAALPDGSKGWCEIIYPELPAEAWTHGSLNPESKKVTCTSFNRKFLCCQNMLCKINKDKRGMCTP